jgi:hypothetical protein
LKIINPKNKTIKEISIVYIIYGNSIETELKKEYLTS